jgi:enoyl-CoA hydratase/carnithine racemase
VALMLVRHSIDDVGIARVELDNPPVNAFDLALVEALAEVVPAVVDAGAHLVIFSGRGPSLSSGGDIKWMYSRTSEHDATSLRRFFRSIQRLFDDVDALPIPTIAAVHGMTLGGGLELALACDLRVAADNARIGFPEANLGLLPAAGGSQRVTEIVGRPLALELMYTGRMLDANDALALGLFNRVVPAADLSGAVDALAADVLRSTPAALAAVKDCVRTRIVEGRSAGLRTENHAIESLAFDPDAVERLEAFYRRSEKKQPQLETQGA